jgi:hypothetical protein
MTITANRRNEFLSRDPGPPLLSQRSLEQFRVNYGRKKAQKTQKDWSVFCVAAGLCACRIGRLAN